jgi:hypothetical protein
MSDIPPQQPPVQQPPAQKITPEYIYAMERRVQDLEKKNSQLQELLDRIDNEFGQMLGELETKGIETQGQVASLETNLGARMDEVSQQSALAQKELARQSELVVRQRVPNTMLLSDSFWMRALAVYGHFFVINLVVSVFFICLAVIAGLVLGVSLPTNLTP